MQTTHWKALVVFVEESPVIPSGIFFHRPVDESVLFSFVSCPSISTPFL